MVGHNQRIIIIGGGAAGIVAAISATRRGASVVLCERMAALGKKILASGNGRCNLCNDTLDSSFYNQASRHLVNSVFLRVGRDEIKRLFHDMGLQLISEDGRVFPATNQSASVLKILEMELKKLSIPVEREFEVSRITTAKGLFSVISKTGKTISAGRVILTTGGKSYPALGSDGSGYAIAKNMGHTVIEPVPTAVPLVVKDPLCHLLQGQKLSAKATCFIFGRAVCESSGDLLFTKYGLSGTAIIDISEEASIAINRHHSDDVTVSVDMAPFISEHALIKELERRIGNFAAPEELLVGILPNKFGAALKNLLQSSDPVLIAKTVKHKCFSVLGTRGWNEADFTAGGIAVDEIDSTTLESKIKKGLYCAGEVIDVNGRRGGYNLAWAWASGYVAGEAAAHA